MPGETNPEDRPINGESIGAKAAKLREAMGAAAQPQQPKQIAVAVPPELWDMIRDHIKHTPAEPVKVMPIIAAMERCQVLEVNKVD